MGKITIANAKINQTRRLLDNLHGHSLWLIHQSLISIKLFLFFHLLKNNPNISYRVQYSQRSNRKFNKMCQVTISANWRVNIPSKNNLLQLFSCRNLGQYSNFSIFSHVSKNFFSLNIYFLNASSNISSR